MSSDKLLANDNAAANTRAEDNSKHYIGTSGGAVDCLRKGKAICVILQPDWPLQSLGRSRTSGLPFKTVLFEFLRRLVRVEMAPGDATPNEPFWQSSVSDESTRSAMAFKVPT